MKKKNDPLEALLSIPSLSNIDTGSSKFGPVVPNSFPFSVDANYRIAIIGEAPGETEVEEGKPFVGKSGEFLRSVMSASGISPMATFFGNVSRHRPPGNDISRFPWTSAPMVEGMQQLKEDITKFDPNICVLLGNTAMHAAGYPHKETVSSWRGSLSICMDPNSPVYGRKIMPTFHPAGVLRQYSWMPLMRQDLKRARAEGESPELHLPQRILDIDLSASGIIAKLDNLLLHPRAIALDIEGYVFNVTCISIADSPNYGFIIPFDKFDSPTTVRLIEKFRAVCSDRRIPKILQNSLYDNFCLSMTFCCPILNVVHDTMLSGWEIYAELPKALATQASLWTREPYYKYERKIDDKDTHYRYCIKDSCVTYEIATAHNKVLQGDSLTHFNFNMQMLPILNYMQYRGMNYDKPKADEINANCIAKLDEINRRINVHAGRPINVNSPTQLAKLLYKDLRLPPQHPKVSGRLDKSKLTTNVDALLALSKVASHPILNEILAYRKIEKIRSYTELTLDVDGRIRCGYNLVGTDTGRLSCSSSATGSGTNLTTITKDLRCLYLPDPEHYFFQLDLEGADGWTVAAHSASAGDRTMLDDYIGKVKPAQAIALLYLHGRQVNSWSRERIREEARVLKHKDNEWLYFTCKRVQHGTNYGLGIPTMVGQILKDSFKLTGNPLYVDKKTAEQLQNLYIQRYPGVTVWQARIKNTIITTGKLKCGSGHTRTFFGRRQDHETYRAALSQEPQANTCYATNMAMMALWKDPLNRRPDGSLIIEPLHQVHDAVCGQFPISQLSFARERLPHYFNNPITIAGYEITIPYDGGYGSSWYDTGDDSRRL